MRWKFAHGAFKRRCGVSKAITNHSAVQCSVAIVSTASSGMVMIVGLESATDYFGARPVKDVKPPSIPHAVSGSSYDVPFYAEHVPQ